MVKIISAVITNDAKINIELHHKINIIQGPSGCGKTYITEELPRLDNAYSIVVVTDALINEPFLTTLLNMPREVILWCDEDITYKLQKRQLIHKLNESNHICVFISRDIFKGVDYPASAVYELVYDELSNTYINKRLYTDYVKLPKSESYVTEDTKSGYVYFKHWLLNVQKAESNKIVDAIKTNSCLIADDLAFGVNIADAIDANLKMFLPKSFEYMLGSKVFSEEVMNNYSIEDMHKYGNKTEERCITRIFRDQCQKLSPPINYNKDEVSIKDPRLINVKAFEEESYNINHYGITENVAETFGIDWNDEQACKKLSESMKTF